MKTLILIAAFTPALVSQSASTFQAAGKNYIGFNITYSEPLPQPYQVHFQVVFNTPSGQLTQGFVVILPTGTFGSTGRAFEIPADWTIASYTLVGEGPYNQ